MLLAALAHHSRQLSAAMNGLLLEDRRPGAADSAGMADEPQRSSGALMHAVDSAHAPQPCKRTCTQAVHAGHACAHVHSVRVHAGWVAIGARQEATGGNTLRWQRHTALGSTSSMLCRAGSPLPPMHPPVGILPHNA
jgi:hypothetical protein